MRLHEVTISGHYEHEGEASERLRVAAPENDLEAEQIAARILEGPEVVSDDSARRDYAFRYELDRHLGDGLFALRVRANDASNRDHAVEIAAGLVMTGVGNEDEPGLDAGLPMWFVSKRLHYRRLEGTPLEYPGPSFGRLRFPYPDALPQRRLFGAAG